LYFGGGTPSLIKAEHIKAIIDEAKKSFLLKDAEITMEVNPAENLKDYFVSVAKAGVNRLSIGLQSANEDELKILSRRHTVSDVIKCVKDARSAGIKNVSLDIMLGIPNQTKESLKRTIDLCLECNPEHLSAYLLSLEKGTPLYKKSAELNIPNDDEAGELYLYATKLLKDAGYERYEISNFARSGNISRHNTKYWQGADYLGLGPAAHSFLKGKRFYYDRDINAYLLNPKEISDGVGGTADERLMLSLRLSSGLSLKTFKNEFPDVLKGDKINRLAKKAELFAKNGLVSFNGDIISLTDEGALVSNSVIASFAEIL
jgi:oxygen-independent coproporphyrinogen-3 oxidase